MSNKFFLPFILLSFIVNTVIFPYAAYAQDTPAHGHVWSSELGRFVKIGTIIHDTPQGQLEYAQFLEEAGDLKKAEEAYSNLFRKFPNTILAQDALFHLGLIQEKQQKYVEAFQNYQKIIDYYPHTDKLNAITERQFKIGNLFLSGKKGKIFNVPIRPAMPLAIKVFKTIANNAPFSLYGAKAQFSLGLAYRKKGKLKEAIEQFKKFIADYPNNDMRNDAFFQIAEITYIMSWKKSNDEKLLQEAQVVLVDYLERYPHASNADKIREMVSTLYGRDAQHIYDIAYYYEKESYLDSAILYYQELVATYPQSSWAIKAQKRLDSFEDPERFLREGEKVLEQKLDKLYAQKAALAAQPVEGPRLMEIQQERVRLEEHINEVKKDIKRLEKEKNKEAQIRWEALRRKKGELKSKKIKLKKKEKLLQEKPSEDLERAIQRWKESIAAEDYALEMEERELRALERRLDIKRIFSFVDVITGRAKKIESIQQFKEKKLKQIIEQESVLEARNKELYRTLNQIEDEIKSLEKKQTNLLDTELKDKEHFAKEEQVLLEEKKKLNVLQDTYKTKRNEYKKVQGFFPSVLGMPKQSVSSIMKPFTKSPLEKIEGTIAATKFEIDTLKKNIAFEEQELERFTRLLKGTSPQANDKTKPKQKEKSDKEEKGAKNIRQERVDKRTARKELMTIEKKINRAHHIIEDAQKKRNALIRELEDAVHDIKSDQSSAATKTLSGMVKPAVLVSQGINAFIFGLKDKAKVVEKKADKLEQTSRDAGDSERIQHYKKEIAQLDHLIKKTDVDIIALEFELEQLIKSLKGSIEIVTKRDLSKSKDLLKQSVKAKEEYIQTIKKDLAKQEKTLKDIIAQKEALRKEQDAQDKEDKKSSEQKEKAENIDDADKRKEKKVKLENELGDLEKQIDTQKRVVSDMEKRVQDERKDISHKQVLKRKWMIFKSADEKINNELNELHEKEHEILRNIGKLIGEQQGVLEKHQSITHEKIEQVKKRIQQMEKYQDRELNAMKEYQKTLFKELDDLNSRMQMLTEERNQIETGLE